MDKLKEWLIGQLKKEQGGTDKFFRLKHWLDRVSMAEFESTRLKYTLTNVIVNKEVIYNELVQPIKDEIKLWEK